MTILDLLIEDKFEPVSKNSKHGVTYESPCPHCKGKDRFHVFMNNGYDERFWCRQCGQSGGIIEYLTSFRSMTYEQACIYSGVTPGIRKLIRRSGFQIPHGEPVTPIQSPSQQWQDRTNALLEWSEEMLWRSEYINIRSWLQNKRGLQDKTIRKMRLGWLPVDHYFEREKWGLPDKLKDDGKTKTKLWIPAGMVIPCFDDNQIQRIRIRKFNHGDGIRYYFTPGSSTIPMVIGSGENIVIVESELDAILLSQEAGDIAGVIALGSAEVHPDNTTNEILRNAGKILVSLDSDNAGAMAFYRHWKTQFPNSFRWPVVNGKDPTDAHINGLNLRNWVIAGIKNGKPQVPKSIW